MLVAHFPLCEYPIVLFFIHGFALPFLDLEVPAFAMYKIELALVTRLFHSLLKFSCCWFSMRIILSDLVERSHSHIGHWTSDNLMPPDCRSKSDTSSPSLVHLGVFHDRPKPTPSPAETVRGERPLPRPIVTSSLAKAVPWLLNAETLRSFQLIVSCQVQDSVYWLLLKSPLVGRLSFNH